MKYQITENEENLFFGKKIFPGVSSDLKVYLHFHFTSNKAFRHCIFNCRKKCWKPLPDFQSFNIVTDCSKKDRTPTSTLNNFTSS